MIEGRFKLKRDLRVDFLRGLALLTIFVDHVPHNRWAAITQQNFGFSDAAELFVALAGFSAVLAYARYFDGIHDAVGFRRIATRIGTIYLYHLGTLITVVLAVSLLSLLIDVAAQIKRLRIEPFMTGEPGAFLGALLLIEQPTYFDILPLYIVLLAAFPLLYIMLRRSVPGTIAASLGLWLIVQLTQFNLSTAAGEGWHFNPFAWQLLLVLGMAAALRTRQGGFSRSPWMIGMALAVLLVSFILRAPWTHWPLYMGAPFIDLKPYGTWMVKSNLGPAQLIHIVAFGYLLLVIVPPRAAWLKRPISRAVADVGANSLEVFCMGIILSVIGAIITASLARTALVESWVTGVGVAVLLLLGAELARRVRERKRMRKRRLGSDTRNDLAPA
jgi:hypothetical protein